MLHCVERFGCESRLSVRLGHAYVKGRHSVPCGGGFIAEDEYVAGADISSEVLADAEENVDIR